MNTDKSENNILTNPKALWHDFFINPTCVASEDFMETREDELPQQREPL